MQGLIGIVIGSIIGILIVTFHETVEINSNLKDIKKIIQKKEK